MIVSANSFETKLFPEFTKSRLGYPAKKSFDLLRVTVRGCYLLTIVQKFDMLVCKLGIGMEDGASAPPEVRRSVLYEVLRGIEAEAHSPSKCRIKASSSL